MDEKITILTFLFVFCSFFSSLFSTVPPLESPVITKVFQDRLSIGDLLEIEGRNFIPSGDYAQTFLIFENLPPILVSPKSSSKILVTVPEGAKTGFVKVKTTCSVNNTYYELESNPIKVLIIWKEYDLRPIASYFISLYIGYRAYPWYIVGGKDDDLFVYFSIERTDPLSYFRTLVHISSDGNWSWENIENIDGYSMYSLAPDLTTFYSAVIYSRGEDRKIVAPGFSSTTVSSCYFCWRPEELAYDGNGNLYVIANNMGSYNWGDEFGCVWKFEKGEAISFDPNSANSLTPGGVRGFLSLLAVGKNGDVACRDYINYYDVHLIVVTKNGDVKFKSAPAFSWKQTVDCKGNVYVMESSYSPSYSYIYRYFPTYFHLFSTGEYFPYFTADGYGNLYLKDFYFPYSIYRMPPEELPSGYYDCFTCCPDPDETCNDGLGDVNECEEENLSIELITNTTNNTEAETSVCIYPLDPQSPTTLDVLFGDAPILKFYNENNCGGPQVEVDWEVVEGSETVSPKLPDNGEKSLFPTKPEIIFADNPQQGEANQLQFQTVHTGEFKLKITPKNQTSNPPKSVELLLKINKPTRLGTTYNNYDNEIINYAHKYGIPPQYIKGQAQQESGLNANAYRYELRTYDKNLLSKKFSDTGYWSDPRFNLQYYRLETTTNGNLYPQDVSPRAKYSYIQSFNANLNPPEWPYTCATIPSVYPFNDTNSPVRDPIKLFDIFEANDGWPYFTYPWKAYNPQTQLPDGGWDASLETRIGPCRRIGWFDSQNPFNSGLETTITYMRATDTFYCGVTAGEDDPQQCAGNEPESAWFLNNKETYIAQTVIASSYGLMQTLYETAVRTMKWKEGVGREAERHPSLLFEADESLDLGVGYDALQMTKVINGQSKNYASIDNYMADLRTAIGAYNSGKIDKPIEKYSNNVFNFAKNYEPQN